MNVLASLPLLVVDLCKEDDVLVALVVVVAVEVLLLPVLEMVSELSDMRSTRRNRSRMAIVGKTGVRWRDTRVEVC